MKTRPAANRSCQGDDASPIMSALDRPPLAGIHGQAATVRDCWHRSVAQHGHTCSNLQARQIFGPCISACPNIVIRSTHLAFDDVTLILDASPGSVLVCTARSAESQALTACQAAPTRRPYSDSNMHGNSTVIRSSMQANYSFYVRQASK